jgi:Phosphotransferase enzyme family
MADRFRFFAPDHIAGELARPGADPVLRAAAQGWARLDQRAPAVADVVRAVHARPEALAAALARTPSTFLHGDPKMGNLGLTADGRAILLDWAYPGAGPRPGSWGGTWR